MVIKVNVPSVPNINEVIERAMGSPMNAYRINEAEKFAPVGPSWLYMGMRTAGYIPENVLLLAHDVVKNEHAYREEFSYPEWNNTNIIMDNSVIETGGAVDADMVFTAAQIVNADVVVLPDVLGDREKSLKTTLDAWPTWYWKFRNYQKMVVIQGESMIDWLESCETLARETDPDWIAVPRVAQMSPDGDVGVANRSDLVCYAAAIFEAECKHPKIHLLGFSDYIHQDLMAASYSFVNSIDSAVPLRQATLGIKNLITGDPGPRGDWFDTVGFESSMIENCKRINKLINSL
jgi:hypothetical protein